MTTKIDSKDPYNMEYAYHSNLDLSFHRKNRLPNLKHSARTARMPILNHILVSKLSSPTRDDEAMLTSFCTKAEKPYFTGDIYSIQPIHFGKLAEFLKKPENMKKGINIAGDTELTDLASVTILPSMSPRETPLVVRR
jgi:hypothetical protein